MIGGYTVKMITKRIKAVAHSFFNFYIPPLWVAVGFLVVLNVWQTSEILKMKGSMRPQSAFEKAVYVTKTGSKYHRMDCRFVWAMRDYVTVTSPDKTRRERVKLPRPSKMLDADVVTLAAARGRGLEPCKVCKP